MGKVSWCLTRASYVTVAGAGQPWVLGGLFQVMTLLANFLHLVSLGSTAGERTRSGEAGMVVLKRDLSTADLVRLGDVLITFRDGGETVSFGV